MSVSFGIDIGGTNIKIGIFNDHKIEKKYFVKTDSDHQDGVINQLIYELKKESLGKKIDKIGVGVPGPVVNGVVLTAQNINWFEPVALKAILEKEFPNTLVEVHNDANAAALGEFNYGSGKEYQSIVFVTLGTGIGGGVIINNKLIEGASGSCGEIGHINLEKEHGRECSCGLSGCFEQYSSATGIMKTATEVFKKYNLKVDGLECKDIFNMALNNHIAASEVVDITLDYLGLGLANVCNVLNPECVIIGGGVSAGLVNYLPKIQQLFDKYAFYSIKSTKIALASLGNDAGIYGLS